MTVEFLKEGAALTVKPAGRLDTMTSPELERQLQPEMAGITSVTVDLEKVEYISSGGLRVLLALDQEMEDRNGAMKVIHINKYIMDILTLTGFLDILTIE